MTYEIKGKRYLKKYTAEALSPVYAANVDAILCSELFDDVKWEAVSEPTAGMTLHTNEIVDESTGVTGLDRNVEIRNTFDAALFCADHKAGLHRAYANAACYVFELPDVAEYPNLTKVKLRVTSDPYNSSGVRLAVHVSDTVNIPVSCAVAREGVARVEGAVPREERLGADGKTYWYAATDTVEISVPDVKMKKYLFVVVGLENYAISRGDWLEGSAFISPTVEIETDGEITGWNGGGVNDGESKSWLICKEDGGATFSDEVEFDSGAEESDRHEAFIALMATDTFVVGDVLAGGSLGVHFVDFYADKSVRAIDSDLYFAMMGASEKPGAGFRICTKKGTEHSISRRKLLLPFVLPDRYNVRKMRVSWTHSDDYAQDSTTPIRRNIWIARGKLNDVYAAPVLQRHELWTAETDRVGDYELLQSLNCTVGDVNDGVEFDVSIGSGMAHTILLTCFIDFGDIPAGDPVMLGSGVTDVIPGVGLLSSPGFSGGWYPRIELV